MDLFAKMTPSPAAGSPPPLFGAMKQRPPALKKDKGELFAVLDKYLGTPSLSTSEKRKRCMEEQHILSLMETVTKDVLGRDKDDALGRSAIVPGLEKAYSLTKSK